MGDLMFACPKYKPNAGKQEPCQKIEQIYVGAFCQRMGAPESCLLEELNTLMPLIGLIIVLPC